MKSLTFLAFGTFFLTQSIVAQEITISYPEDWCPYACKVGELPDGKMGFTMDVYKAILEPKGYKIKVQHNPFPRIIKNLEQGKTTAIPSAYIEEAPFAKRPATATAQGKMCFWGKKKAKEYKKPEDVLSYGSVGMIKGYSFSDPKLVEIRKKNPKKFKVMGGNDAVFRLGKMVAGDRIDVFHEDLTTVRGFQKESKIPKDLEPKGCEPPTYAFFSVSPKYPEADKIVKIVEDGIRQLRKSGEFEKIYNYYGLSDWPESENK